MYHRRWPDPEPGHCPFHCAHRPSGSSNPVPYLVAARRTLPSSPRILLLDAGAQDGHIPSFLATPGLPGYFHHGLLAGPRSYTVDDVRRGLGSTDQELRSDSISYNQPGRCHPSHIFLSATAEVDWHRMYLLAVRSNMRPICRICGSGSARDQREVFGGGAGYAGWKEESRCRYK